MGFKEWFKEGMQENKARLEAEAMEHIKRKAELDAQGVVYCPKCLSTSISPQKKGFSVGKALVGGALTGGIGLLAGAIGSNKIDLYCMKCGNKFRPK